MATMGKEPDLEAGGGGPAAAEHAWRRACAALQAEAGAERGWRLVAGARAPAAWHELGHCVAYQVGVWAALVSGGAAPPAQAAAFELALVLRHAPRDLAARLLPDLLQHHPQSRDLTSYILALLTEDEACGSPEEWGPAPPGPAPARDLQLFADCELAVLAARGPQYDEHARRIRREYAQLSHADFGELRVKVLNQLTKIPKLYHTAEFEHLEAAARQNIEREIRNLKEQLREAKTS